MCVNYELLSKDAEAMMYSINLEEHMSDFTQTDSINSFNKAHQSDESILDTLDLKEEIAENTDSFQSETAQNIGKVEQSDQSEQSGDENRDRKSQEAPEAGAGDRDRQEAPEAGASSQQISELSSKMDALTELFKSKIETDEYKNHLFDEMHRQLAKYQDDALKSVIEPFISELITLLENVRQYEKFTPEEASPENYAKLRKRLSDVRGDIEDILEEMDVSKYETDEVIPDTKRQKIIKTVRTDDASKNNTIESKLSDGYIYRNKIIKYEKVAVYKTE